MSELLEASWHDCRWGPSASPGYPLQFLRGYIPVSIHHNKEHMMGFTESEAETSHMSTDGEADSMGAEAGSGYNLERATFQEPTSISLAQQSTKTVQCAWDWMFKHLRLWGNYEAMGSGLC